MKYILAIALLFVLQAYAQFNTCPTVSSASCGTTGTCLNFSVDASGTTYCSCQSGFGGNDCQTTVDPALSCVFSNVSDTATDFPPINVTASFNNDIFTVSIYSPLVAQRLYTKIAVDSHGVDDYNCTYPGNYWAHTVEGCTDRFVGNMPWSDTTHCGWVFDNVTDPYYYQYNATMIIDHYDNLNTFSGRGSAIMRTTQHVVPLLVQFQRYIDVSSTISVSSPVRLLVAVTKQEVDPITRNAVIELATNLLYPYIINTSSLTPPGSTPMSFQLTEIIDSQTSALCPNTPGSTCTQRFRISITTNGACTITGNYGILFGLICQSGIADCNLPPNAQASVLATIVSEDFCAKVSAKVEITGALNSYSSNAYTSARSAFLVDQVSYFKAVVTSPQATLTKSTIRSVSVVNANNSAETYLVYSDGQPNPIFANTAHFSLDNAGSDFAEFYFTLNASMFNNATNSDVTKSYTVVARVDVEFKGVPGVKRVVMESNLNNRQVALGAQFQLSNQAANFGTPDTSSASSLGFCLLGLLAFMFATLLL